MNPPCARCNKTVYPTEKLNCLDKTWHKGCFNCETCRMKLTMKNYKGYNKLPYCNAHYPTTKFTAIADTPENLRLKKQSQTQSQVEYQKQFKSSLQNFTTVADDPESLRLKKATQQASNVSYARPNPPNPQPGAQAQQGRYKQPTQPPPAQYQPPQQEQYRPPPAPEPAAPALPPMQPPNLPPPNAGPKYVAVYDYQAADDDEVSFQEGDVIMNAEVIDAGWMTGTVQRTGEHGMLPSNYVEQS